MNECGFHQDVIDEYQPQWNQIKSAWFNRRMPQALLFVGSLDSSLKGFICHVTQFIICKKNKSESFCSDCMMGMRNEHPDVMWIKPEKSGGPIKIDQIRELQRFSYLTPQRAQYRIIIIESADRMNVAAANALLKILEEPAPHLIFLLIATQLSTVLPTVLSRCQIMRFSSREDLSAMSFLQLAQSYAQDSEQVRVINESELILNGLIAVIEQKEHPCMIASQWGQFDLKTLLWFLYVIYAQIQVLHISGSIQASIDPKMTALALLLSPAMIFEQIDKINKLQRKLSHNMHVNTILVLEDLLLSLH